MKRRMKNKKWGMVKTDRTLFFLCIIVSRNSLEGGKILISDKWMLKIKMMGNVSVKDYKSYLRQINDTDELKEIKYNLETKYSMWNTFTKSVFVVIFLAVVAFMGNIYYTFVKNALELYYSKGNQDMMTILSGATVFFVVLCVGLFFILWLFLLSIGNLKKKLSIITDYLKELGIE